MTGIDDRYRAALRESDAGRLTEFDLTGYDRIGVPVHGVVFDRADGSDAHGVGYGSTSEAAVVGALGEVAERVLLPPPPTVTRASFRELRAAHGASRVVDPASLVLDAGADYSPERPIAWATATRWPTDEQVLVPRDLVLSSPTPDTDGLITPVTNGLGAGDTLKRAVSHGLLELIQRDGDNVRFRALDRGVVVDLDACADTEVQAIRSRLQAAGIEPVVKLASSEFACVVYCIGHDDDPDVEPMALSAVGEGAHPDRDVAVAKAMLEFASSRARRAFAFGPLERVRDLNPEYLDAELHRPLGPQEPRALAAMREWSAWDAATMRSALAPMFRQTRTVDPAALPTSGARTPAELLAELGPRVGDVLYVAGEAAGMHAAKVLCPGLEVETMSYLRLGARAATDLLDLDAGLVGRGAPSSPAQRRVHLTDADEQRLGPLWIDRDAVRSAVGALYPLYREPRRHAVGRTTG